MIKECTNLQANGWVIRITVSSKSNYFYIGHPQKKSLCEKTYELVALGGYDHSKET